MGKWSIIGGFDCYVEDGIVRRAIVGKGNNQRTAFPYKRTTDGTWTSATPTPDTLRKGLKRGNYRIV